MRMASPSFVPIGAVATSKATYQNDRRIDHRIPESMDNPKPMRFRIIDRLAGIGRFATIIRYDVRYLTRYDCISYRSHRDSAWTSKFIPRMGGEAANFQRELAEVAVAHLADDET